MTAKYIERGLIAFALFLKNCCQFENDYQFQFQFENDLQIGFCWIKKPPDREAVRWC